MAPVSRKTSTLWLTSASFNIVNDNDEALENGMEKEKTNQGPDSIKSIDDVKKAYNKLDNKKVERK